MFPVIFLVMFTLGGSTGVILGNGGLDVGLHDSYYVVGHFHFVLSLGAIISILVGVSFYEEIIFGILSIHPRARNRRLVFFL